MEQQPISRSYVRHPKIVFEEKKKRKLISLIIWAVLCISFTALVFTDFSECEECGNKIAGKYYISMSEKIYCKSCGKDYYRGYPGNLDTVTDSVDNTLRNVLLFVEIIVFGGAIFYIRKQKFDVGNLYPVVEDMNQPPVKSEFDAERSYPLDEDTHELPVISELPPL